MAEIEIVSITSIDPNPLRRLAIYPYNSNKLEALQRSIEGVGLWEGIIGRRVGNRVQLAFGHHRIEAARRAGLTTIPIIIRDLTDEEMLKFLGRENLEDYNADFLVMLETWEAASEYCGARARAVNKSSDLIDIAKILGWVKVERSSHGRGAEGKVVNAVRTNDTAEGCHAAATLIAGGHLQRENLVGLTVRAARELCQGIMAEHALIEQLGKLHKSSEREIKQAKNYANKTAEGIADDLRKGNINTKEVRGEISGRSFSSARKAKNASPYLHLVGPKLIAAISKLAKGDKLNKKFHDIKKSLDRFEIKKTDDLEIIKRIANECGYASNRFDEWERIFTEPRMKIVPLKAIEKKE
jgi:ParB/RepB/Spo0J family partition protein